MIREFSSPPTRAWIVYNCLNRVGTVLKVPSIIQRQDCSRLRMLVTVVKSRILFSPIVESLTKKFTPSKVTFMFSGIVISSIDSGSERKSVLRIRLIDLRSASFDGRDVYTS